MRWVVTGRRRPEKVTGLHRDCAAFPLWSSGITNNASGGKKIPSKDFYVRNGGQKADRSRTMVPDDGILSATCRDVLRA